MKITISITVNGILYNKEVDENLSLLRFLREDLGLIGTKNGCGTGHCGTCTVIVNKEAKRSCIVKMGKINNGIVETIEGVSLNDKLNYIQQGFIDEGAVQCGFCTPGMIMATKALLDKIDHPTDDEIKEALKHNICRCTGYITIIKAVQRAAFLKQQMVLEELIITSDNYIGKPVLRKDALSKVKGERVFADDYSEEDMLFGKLVFSKHAHAKIISIDAKKAKIAPGVVTILTGKDVPGINAFGLFESDQPVIAEDEVKFLGEVVAVVYAESSDEAENAAGLIEVEYEVLESVLSPLEAFKEDAPLIHKDKKDNVIHYVNVRKGDIDKGFEDADVVVEGYYYTPAIEHAYLEPEACLAKPESNGTLTVWTGNQGSHAYQEMIARNLNIPLEKVRVIYTPCGGGFGGKEEPTVQIHAALGAYKLGRAVKMVLTREESIRMSTKRHPMHIWMKHAATKEGKLLAMESKVIADAGAYISQTKPVIFRSAVTATGPYVIPNVKADSYGLYTHNNPSGAFRGFGSTQASFAAEIQMDKIAKELNIDSVRLRKLNAFEKGKVTSTGQVLKDGVGYLGTLEAAEKALLKMKKEYEKIFVPAHKKIGFGIASSYKNVGIGTGKLDQAGAIVNVEENGRVTVKMGATDMGQGADTIMAQIAATTLKVPYEIVDVIACDTLICPDGGMTTASRQTYVTGNAVKKASEILKEKLIKYTDGEKITQEALKNAYIIANEKKDHLLVETDYRPPKTYPHEADGNHVPGKPLEAYDIHYSYCFASVAVAVEVDTLSGEVKVLKVSAAQDVGKAIHPQNVTGQIEGAVVMGMGFALSEEFLQDDKEIITNNLNKLKIPKIKDTPDIEAIIVEVPQLEGPFGAKGMGEVGLNPMAPAISNAIYDAVGIRLQSLPMKKEKVLAALKG
ncbi:CO/xanthine dehydrogenase Mo-binding subunit [Natranaerovirga pectinivora]|uniref:CO/xanthine dehydrogenase Mo-binding subunit n=1 Tax=Natranaerovirga pectinivora TaxID=682400 RepID=A0A4R3MND2_9FIRM|nr:molybdopterin cofactor-binding domain-containing protein [Natranaerovirga pectinivora]TCT16747.1 CO/xanthine dehydrogenase Mo-binding subunit [Natranaerovirga pectinivora]